MQLPSLLLLGGSGFIGRAVLRALARLPPGTVRVRALLRRPDSVPDHPDLDKIEGSLEQLPAGLEPETPYVLVHLAVKQIDRDGSGYHATNVDATRALLARLGPRLRGILYASSMSAYGQGAQDGVDEHAPPAPDTPLARSRYQAETVIGDHAREAGVSALCMRPRFVIGQGDRFVLPTLAKFAARRLQIGSGSQRFSFMDVDDYAQVILRLAAHLAWQHRQGTVAQAPIHIGYAQPLAYAQIARILRTPDAEGPRLRLPMVPGMTRLLRALPMPSMAQLATRMELLGLSHWGDVSALAAAIGDDIVGRDPIQVFERAARHRLE